MIILRHYRATGVGIPEPTRSLIQQRPALATRFAPVTVPSALLLAVVVMAAGMLVLASLPLALRMVAPRAHSLAAYASLFSAETAQDALDRFSFRCTRRLPHGSEFAQTADPVRRSHDYCVYHPETGPLSMIGVTLSATGQVAAVDLYATTGELRAGDLALLWGRPTVYIQDELLELSWQDRPVRAFALRPSGAFRYDLPLAAPSLPPAARG